MDGYSVSEAASVLGVPIERVWELLARGVLAGAPEGDTGMRVFLQSRPAQAPAPPPENGGAREPERELSPFRELLTEFRNLTERYGQALLALGESRGEVASLRSRVDLLEARMDLGLPPPRRAPASVAWGAATYPAEQAVVPAAPGAGDADPSAEAEEHRARPRGPRRATESFAEALARAEDPSLPELPDAEPAAGTADRTEALEEPGLPREMPAAESVPVAEEMAEEAASDEIPIEAPAEEPSAPTPAPADVGSAVSEGQPEAEAEGASAEPSGPAEVMPARAESEAPATWDTDRYTAAIEEPDWFEAEADDSVPNPASAVADDAQPPEPESSDSVPSEPAAAPEETLMWLPDADAEASVLPGSTELEAALEALDATAQVTSQPEADEDQPGPSERPGPPPAVPPSALRYRPVTPAGPTGRAYRRLRRIFPD